MAIGYSSSRLSDNSTDPNSSITWTSHESEDCSGKTPSPTPEAGKSVAGLGTIDSDGVDDWIARVGLGQMLSELWGTASTRQEQYELSIKVWETAANNWSNWAEFGTVFWKSCRELRVWDVAPGGEDEYKRLIRYKTVVRDMQVVSAQSEVRKKRSYNAIATKWGQGWTVDFDIDLCPDGKDRFPVSPSEKFLASIECLARDGWDKRQVYYTLNWASTLRLSVGGPGIRSGAWFMLVDVALAIDELGMIIKETPDTTQITIEALCDLLKTGKNRALGGGETGDDNKAGWKEKTVENQVMAGGKFASGKANVEVLGVRGCRTGTLKQTRGNLQDLIYEDEHEILVVRKRVNRRKAGKETTVDSGDELVSSEEEWEVEKNNNNHETEKEEEEEEPAGLNTDETGFKGWNKPMTNGVRLQPNISATRLLTTTGPNSCYLLNGSHHTVKTFSRFAASSVVASGGFNKTDMLWWLWTVISWS